MDEYYRAVRALPAWLARPLSACHRTLQNRYMRYASGSAAEYS